MSILVKNYHELNFLNDFDLLRAGVRILNAGSSSVRYNSSCINLDIQHKPNVDIVGNIQNIPLQESSVDVIVCNAVLQYCTEPQQAAKEFYRVLAPGGFLFLDAPWIQPYCNDTPDRFRFSKNILTTLFADFEIIQCKPSIRAGSAFGMLGIDILGNLTYNRYINYILRKIATFLFYPFRWIKTVKEDRLSGAFYLICRKPI
jgi:SAM-dependent methyltransferase